MKEFQNIKDDYPIFEREINSKTLNPASNAIPPDDDIMFLCIPLSVGIDIDTGNLISR